MTKLAPDRYAPIVNNTFTEEATIQPCTLHQIAAREHRLPGLRVSLFELTEQSSDAAYEAVALYARYCQRELDMDEIPYSVYRGVRRADESTTCWLWTLPPASEPGVHVIGAACFRRDAQTAITPFWQMRFLWFFPYYRNRHLFSKAWPTLLARHGAVHFEPRALTLRVFLHGQPYYNVTTTTGTPLRVYTQDPYCPRHGPLLEQWKGSWVCGGKSPDGTPCTHSYRAPAPARSTM
jgi:hypothetical protein